MGLNFGGLGLAFVGKDSGLVAGAQSAARALDTLRVGQTSLLSAMDPRRVTSWLQSFSAEPIERARTAMSALTGANMNLTTGFEAQQAQLGQEARRTAANLGFVGREARQVASEAAGMAYGMNQSADTTAGAVANWRWAREELHALGIQGPRDLVRIQAVTGVTAATIGDFARTAHLSLHLTTEETGLLIGSFTRAGQAIGDVGGVVNMLTPLMDNLSRHASLMGIEVDHAQLAEFGRQMASLIPALHGAGIQGARAQQFVQQFSETLLESREQLSGLVHGIQEDLPQLPQSIAIALGNAPDAFELLNQGPEHFVAGLARMMQVMRSAGASQADMSAALQTLQARLSETLGPEQTGTLINAMRSMNPAALENMRNFRGTVEDLRRVGQQGFSTGRTLQDAFDMARQSAIAAFRAIGRRDAINIVHDMSAEFRVFNAHLREVAGQGGLLGAFAERMSAANSVGALAFIPRSLRPISMLIGTLGEEIGPALVGLRQLGFSFSSLAHPLAPILTGLGLLTMRFVDLRMHGRNTKQAVEEIAHSLVTFLQRLPSLVTHGFESLAHALQSTGSALSSIKWGKLWADLLQAGRKAWAQIRPQLRAFAQSFYRAITGALDNTAASGDSAAFVGSAIGRMLRSGVLAAWGYLTQTVLPAARELLHGLWDGLLRQDTGTQSVSARLGQQLGLALRNAFEFAKEGTQNYFRSWWQDVGDIWADESRPLSERMRAIAGRSEGLGALGLGAGLAANQLGILGPALVFAARGLNVLWQGLRLAWGGIGLVVRGLGSLGRGIQWVSELLNVLRARGGASMLWRMLTQTREIQGAVRIFSTLGRVFTTIGEALFSVEGAVVAVIVGLGALAVGFHEWPEQTERLVERMGQALRTFMADLFEYTVFGIARVVRELVSLVSGTPGEVSTTISEFGRMLTVDLPKYIDDALPGWSAALSRAGDALIRLLQDAVIGAMEGIGRALERAFPEDADRIREFMTSAIAYTQVFFAAFRGLATGIGPIIVGPFRAMFTVVSAIITGVVGIVTAAFRLVGNILADLGHALWTFGSGWFTVIGAVASFVVRSFSNLWTFLQGFGRGFVLLFTDPLAGLRMMWNALVQLVSSTASSVGTLLSGIATGVGTMIAGALTMVIGVFVHALEFIGSLAQSLFGVFRGILQGTWEFFSGWFEGIRMALTNAFGAVGTAMDALPLTVRADLDLAIQAVNDFVGGFVGGLDTIWGRVMSVFGHSVHTVVAEDLAQVTPHLRRFQNGFHGAVTAPLNGATAASAQLAQGMVTAMTAAQRSAAAVRESMRGMTPQEANRVSGQVSTSLLDSTQAFETAFQERRRVVQSGMDGLTTYQQRLAEATMSSLQESIRRGDITAQQARERFRESLRLIRTEQFQPPAAAAPTAPPPQAQRQMDGVHTEMQRQSTEFQTQLSASITNNLTQAFITSYARVLRENGKFLELMNRAYNQFTANLVLRFGRMWGGIIELSGMAVPAIEQELNRAMSSLLRLQGIASRAEAMQGVAGDAPRASVRLQHAATDTDLYDAVHQPDWYNRDYKDRFERNMGSLRDAILASRGPGPRGAPVAGGTTVSRANMEAATQNAVVRMGRSP